MKIILAIDGGGCKGFIPLEVLLELSRRLGGDDLWKHIDFAIGSSVGAILSSLVASGRLSMYGISELMQSTCQQMFTRRPWPLLPKYSRDPWRAAWNTHVGDDVPFGQSIVPICVTAVSALDRMTHYFYSDQPRDAKDKMRTIIEYSFAAPIYFGGIEDPSRKQLWLDGGTGMDNCPLLEAAYIANTRYVSVGERVHILSLGCGGYRPTMSYEHATRRWMKNLREMLEYMAPADGGLARQQSIRRQVDFMRAYDQSQDLVTAQRIDVELPEKLDQMDAVEYIGQYRQIGRQIAQQLDTTPFFARG